MNKIEFRGNLIQIIERYTFNYCQNLQGTLILPNSIKTIDFMAFCQATSINAKTNLTLILPENLEKIDGYAFDFCYRLTGSLVIPKFSNQLYYYNYEKHLHQ